MLLLAARPAHAQDAAPEVGLRDMLHARAYAMGGAYRALGQDAESIDGNPASLAMQRQYLTEVSGAWDWHTKYAFGTVSILDSTSQPIAGGVSYHLVSVGRGADRTTANVSTLALAYPLSESWFLGASTKYVQMSGALQGNAITADAGVSLHLFAGLVASVSGHNLIDIRNPLMTRYYAASFGYLGGAFTLAADIKGDFGIAPTAQFAYSFGGEYVFGPLPVRGGYSYDSITHSHFISGGFGFDSSGSGFDVAYRHEIGGSEGRLLALTIRIKIS